MSDKMQDNGEERMQKSLESLRLAFAKIRTGRANPALLEDIKVSCYGSETSLKQVANITVEEGRTLVVSPWDPKLLRDIEKSLLKSDVGITPTTMGAVIRMPLPALTEENRRQLIKTAKRETEKARIAVRNIRRDVLNSLKRRVKDKDISADADNQSQGRVQKLTDGYIAKMDAMLERKAEDLLDIN